MGKYFGTDGFRGESGVVLTAEHAFLIGRYLGWFYGKDHKAKIVIGKDTRRSSYMYESALASGIVSSGADAYLLHVTTTPSVSYITRTEGFDCGVMISASHNAYMDNGIKLMNADGEKMDDGVQNEIEKYIDGDHNSIPYATNDAIGCRIDYYDGRDKYIDYLCSVADTSFKGHKIGLDCANGSSWMIGPEVFNKLGADISVISNAPDGVNINTNCGSTHIEGLMKYVVDNKLECGFAFDGDADRCLAVDEKGNLVDGDKIIYICGKYLKSKGELANNKVVTTVMSNFGLYKALDREGIGYEKTAVGDKYVYENMKENGHVIGGEQSGHIIFRKNARTGDGILTAIMVLSVMAETKRSLSSLADEVEKYPQVLKNVIVDDKDNTLNDNAVIKAVKDAEAALGDNGRVLLRKSGTEPLLRVMAEAGSDEECEKHVDAIIDSMKASGHLIRIK